MRRLAGLAFAVGLLVPRFANAQFVSPGPLARAHASIDGLSNCGKCHEGTAELPARLCLKCHAEIGDRTSANKGFHGRLPASELNDCRKCHSDHRGREFVMVDWGRGTEYFDHSKTGYPLRAKHAKVRCGDCHDVRRIQDAKVTRFLHEQPRRTSFLGLSTKCGPPCHFDDHRGQLGLDCQKCHTEEGWKAATKFDHGKTDFPLRGKHQKVKCGDCHPSEKDDQPKDAFPRPVTSTYMKMSPVDHESCESCHEDVHKGEFGPACESCHVETGWKVIKQGRGGKEAGFHDKTRFPLRGGHIGVDCRSCHGPFPGRPAVFKGLAFSKCTDCHADAHLGQLAGQTSAVAKPVAAQSPPPTKPPIVTAQKGGVACEPCHNVNRFFPALYELEQHAKTKFPLEGGHQAAACRGCHPVDPKLQARVPAAVRNELKRERRGEMFSFATMRPAKKPELCASCHADVHLGQLAEAGRADNCSKCHRPAAWANLSFDHNKDSRFPLTGKHAETACAGCHKSERIGKGGAAKMAVRYKPMALECASCHADYHLGQFRVAALTATASRGVQKRTRECDFCHQTKSFKQTLTFNHNDPKFTSYPLEGKHAHVKCERCHPTVVVAGKKTARYRPLPRECEDCHVDYHKGEFRGFTVAALDDARVAATSSGQTRCAPCHSVKSWGDVSFDHDRTGFPLHGAHETVNCKRCHPSDFKKRVPDVCSGCHRDAHAGEFGLHCESCHQEKNWQPNFNADAHRRTNFPLSGAHALIPCEECHGKRRDRSFSRAPVDCLGCHRGDLQRAAATTIDHNAAGFSNDCRQCHDVWRFTPAKFAAHDSCFVISAGSHRGLRCLSCHSSTMGFQVTGQCATNNVICSSCHAHACAKSDMQHQGVLGYKCGPQYDETCYQCHAAMGTLLHKQRPR